MRSFTTVNDHRDSTFPGWLPNYPSPSPLFACVLHDYSTMICGKPALFQSKVAYDYSGSDDVEIQNDELQICSKFDFISQMATFDVEVSTADVLPRREIFPHAEHMMISRSA